PTRNLPPTDARPGFARGLLDGASLAGGRKLIMAREAGRILRLNGDAGELFDGRQAGGYLRQAVVPQGSHALADRGALDVFSARLRDREAFELLAHGQELVHADPSLVAGLVATGATLLAVEDHAVAGRRDLR